MLSIIFSCPEELLMIAFKQPVTIKKKLLFSDGRPKQNEYFNSPIFSLSAAIKK